MSQANSEEFIPIFANNPRELKAFLEHMIEVDPRSPQGVYDTLLELRLQDWAHEQDPEVGPEQTHQLRTVSSRLSLELKLRKEDYHLNLCVFVREKMSCRARRCHC